MFYTLATWAGIVNCLEPILMTKENLITVLLVDDNLTFIRIATRLLDAHDGIAVVGAIRGGEDALTQIRELQPEVVIVDTSMPSLPGGLAFIGRLRSVLPDVWVIALTLIGTDGYRRAALGAGADDFVPKAAMGTDLLAAIQRVREVSPVVREVV
jgi:DNA-binding NarL/FixJ family response regulator